METPKSMFGDEDEDIPAPIIQGEDDNEEDFVEAAASTNKTIGQDQEVAEQFLMLSDFDRTTKLFRAALTALGNSESGAISTLNTLIKRSEVLDKEQRDIIAPLLGELKALLLSSQDELKNFNSQAQKNLETQIREVIGNVDFSPIQKRVAEANAQILESSNALQTKAEAIEALANRVKKLSFFQTLKWLLAGGVAGTVLMYGFFSYHQELEFQKLQAEFDAKIQSLEARTSVFSKLKSDDWNALIVDNQGVKNLQIVVRDTSSQANCGRVFNTDPNGKKYQVSFFNIPIYK